MEYTLMMKPVAPVAIAVGLALSTTTLAASPDFGELVEQLARAQSVKLFGTAGTLEASSTASISAAAADTDPTALVRLAQGLTAQVVSAAANLGPNIDMMALWPNDSTPTHIIACNEQGSGQVGVQRISLADGSVADIVKSGLTACDPVEITPWGTIVFGEEAGTSGRMFELINPLNTTDVVIAADGSTSGGTNAGNIVWRSALGKLSYEGISVYPNGVVYYGDENRPGNGVGGGAYFKFIPDVLFAGGDGTLEEAAFVAATIQTTLGVDYIINNGPGTSTPDYQPLVTHYEAFAMPDNVAYQPGSGNWLIHEDGEGPGFGRNNDVWACTDDGRDRNGLADACARIISINDLGAETTGGVFDATGTHFYLSVQHNVTGHGVVLKVSGWKNAK
jgi:secreted PhoX family phosphatase